MSKETGLLGLEDVPVKIEHLKVSYNYKLIAFFGMGYMIADLVRFIYTYLL